MSDVTNYDGRLEAMAGYCETMYLNIAKVNNAFHDQTEDAYTANLPSNYFDFFGVKKVGGKTVVFNQLVSDAVSSATVNDVTLTNNGDGSYTIDGTASATAIFIMNSNVADASKAGHKIYISALPDSNMQFYVSNEDGTKEVSAQLGAGYIATATTYRGIILRIPSGNTVDNVTFYPQIHDLTLMFGAGNEPTSVSQFEAMRPATYYEYDTGSLLSFGVTEILSKDADDVTLETFSIPEEITTAEGYGWSCPGAYNYIDFDTKKFVQAVGSREYEAGDESDATVITDGINTHYKLDEPLAFDVDLPDEIITKAEAGGTLTFPNQHGDDYRIPVPVEMEYIGVA